MKFNFKETITPSPEKVSGCFHSYTILLKELSTGDYELINSHVGWGSSRLIEAPDYYCKNAPHYPDYILDSIKPDIDNGATKLLFGYYNPISKEFTEVKWVDKLKDLTKISMTSILNEVYFHFYNDSFYNEDNLRLNIKAADSGFSLFSLTHISNDVYLIKDLAFFDAFFNSQELPELIDGDKSIKLLEQLRNHEFLNILRVYNLIDMFIYSSEHKELYNFHSTKIDAEHLRKHPSSYFFKYGISNRFTEIFKK